MSGSQCPVLYFPVPGPSSPSTVQCTKAHYLCERFWLRNVQIKSRILADLFLPGAWPQWHLSIFNLALASFASQLSCITCQVILKIILIPNHANFIFFTQYSSCFYRLPVAWAQMFKNAYYLLSFNLFNVVYALFKKIQEIRTAVGIA